MFAMGGQRTLASPSIRHPSESWDLFFLMLIASDARRLDLPSSQPGLDRYVGTHERLAVEKEEIPAFAGMTIFLISLPWPNVRNGWKADVCGAHPSGVF
jgi:hypothetical protein